MISPKLKAGSLLYAIFISFLVVSVLSIFILFAQYNRVNIESYNGRIKAISTVNSAINYLLVLDEERAWEEEKQLIGEDPHTIVKMNSIPWGMFQLIKAQCIFKNDTFQKAAIAGYKILQDNNTALYLADKNQSLSLAGDARIKGDAFLSKRGLKRAYIEGRSYSGRTMIEGKLQLSEKRLPAINQNIESSIAQLLKIGIPSIVDTLYSYNADDGISIARSAKQSIGGLYSEQTIFLDGEKLNGPIIIKSETEIKVSNNIHVENAILIAPIIRIESGFQGSLQAIASDTIIIGTNCQLNYPSALGVSTSNPDAYIELGENTRLIGEMAIMGDDYKLKNALISIQKGVEIMGNVYSAKKLAFKGNIFGSVMAEKLYLRTPSSIYENHMLDGVIDRNKLDKAYVGSGFIKAWHYKAKEIMLWLN